MYIVCKDHLEEAIDKFLEEYAYEDAPDIVDLKTTSFKNWDPPATCQQCNKPGEYLVV